MTEEIEVKILDVSRAAVESRLSQAGAKLVFDDDIAALFFDSPDGAIAAARDLLRLRREGRRSVLTFKGYRREETEASTPESSNPEIPESRSIAAKVRRELETGVSDFEATRAILESLGLRPVRTVTKHRTTYELPGARFAFDRHTGELAYIPEFLEIEGDDRVELERAVRLLGFAPGDCKPWGLPELVAHYSGSAGD